MLVSRVMSCTSVVRTWDPPPIKTNVVYVLYWISLVFFFTWKYSFEGTFFRGSDICDDIRKNTPIYTYICVLSAFSIFFSALSFCLLACGRGLLAVVLCIFVGPNPDYFCCFGSSSVTLTFNTKRYAVHLVCPMFILFFFVLSCR